MLTLGEIHKGIEALPKSDRKLRLLDWRETELPTFFAAQILDIDEEVTDRWGRLLAAAGRPLPAIDSLLAATAITHGLVMVTRNVDDFVCPELEIINPWNPWPVIRFYAGTWQLSIVSPELLSSSSPPAGPLQELNLLPPQAGA